MRKLWLALVVSFSGFLGCSASAADLDLTGINDDVAASVIIKSWLSDLGYSPELVPGEKQLSIQLDGRYVVAPKISKSGVDRLIVYKYFKGKPSNARSEVLKEIVREINNRYNVCSAYVDDDGDLNLRFLIYFDDKLTPKLFRLSLDHVKSASSQIISEYRPKFKPYYD
jgi:hypothetical protein